MNEAPAYLKNLKKESVVQSVINCLTDAMRSRELKPGDKIPPEPELASALGVARSSVREAIKILTYLGVLESKPSEGTFVRSGFSESMIDPMVYGIILNQDSFANLMELREIAEAGMLRLAMRRCEEDELQRLESLLSAMRDALQSENAVDEFFRVDNAFHDCVSQMGKNPLADKIGRVVRTLTYSTRYETVSEMLRGGRGDELVAAHAELLDTLKNQRADRVEQVVREGYFVEVLGRGEA